MNQQDDALLRLLRDDDPATLGLVRGVLRERGPEALPELRALLAEAEPVAARRLRGIIGEIAAQSAAADFTRLCASFGADGDLEEAAWQLAAVFLPGEDFAPQRALLDAWGEEVTRRLAKAGNTVDRIETLVEYLAHEVRLHGNDEDYDNLANSLLPEVIDTRRGLPITLSLVYMLVGKRAGLQISGVGLPGHFLIRHGPNFFDPFHGGARVGLEECRSRVMQQGRTLTAATLQPYPAPLFLVRMLTNIRVRALASDPALAAELARWIEGVRGANDAAGRE
jgi:regulator of sirC expression with transglutaminase-like and TPR domain